MPKTSMRQLLFVLLFGVCLGLSACKSTPKKAPRPSIYDAKADATEQVKTATALARRDARRVLVMFGGDWCGWCHKLHGLFRSDAEIRSLLAEEYVLVMVDTQAPHADTLLEQCRGDVKTLGYPFLGVLDGQGKVVTQQRTLPFEQGDHHDPAKVKAFLEKWAAPKLAASKVFEEGLAKASGEDKPIDWLFPYVSSVLLAMTVAQYPTLFTGWSDVVYTWQSVILLIGFAAILGGLAWDAWRGRGAEASVTGEEPAVSGA